MRRRTEVGSRVRAALLAGVALLAHGCVSTAIEIGAPPRVERLERELEPGRSTAEDVLRVLGPPSGTGSNRLPGETQPRPMWTWRHERSATSEALPAAIARSLLFVYFRDGRYDGYLWFSSVAPRSGPR